MKSCIFVDYENKCQSFVREGVPIIEKIWGEQHPPVQVFFYHSYEPRSRQVPEMLREKAWLEERRVPPGRNMVDTRLKSDVIDFCDRHQNNGEGIRIFVICGGDKGYRNLANSCALPVKLVVIEVPPPNLLSKPSMPVWQPKADQTDACSVTDGVSQDNDERTLADFVPPPRRRVQITAPRTSDPSGHAASDPDRRHEQLRYLFDQAARSDWSTTSTVAAVGVGIGLVGLGAAYMLSSGKNTGERESARQVPTTTTTSQVRTASHAIRPSPRPGEKQSVC
jgi:hypothetical protein